MQFLRVYLRSRYARVILGESRRESGALPHPRPRKEKEAMRCLLKPMDDG
jgi:hypothetical protein